MLKAIFGSLVGVLCLSGIAMAQTTCASYTYPLSNGSTADADQVMANFNQVRNCVNAVASGGTLANPTLTGTINTGRIDARNDTGPSIGLYRAGGYAGLSFYDVIRAASISSGPNASHPDSSGSNYLTFFTSTSSDGAVQERMRITNNGDVGIGTAGGTISHRLEVVGTVAASGTTSANGGLIRGIATETTAARTVAATDTHIIANGTATLTLTLPTASAFAGRELTVRTIQSYAVVSNASNVVPCAGGSLTATILAGTAGRWALLVSDGTNWQIQMCN